MVRYAFRIILALLPLLTVLTVTVQAQSGRPPMKATGDQIKLLHADSLVGVNVPGQSIRRVYNNVQFQQKGMLMYCDLAVQNATTNVIEAYGNVRLVQGDTISVRGDTMFYYGNTRQSIVNGRVLLRDRKMTLTTTKLDYDLISGIAHYPPGAPDRPGRIVDKENVLTSREGFYDTRSKLFTFRQDVKLVNPKGTLTADSLLYNSATRIATFMGPTRIVNKDGVLTAVAGQYNTVTGISNFRRRATVETPKYRLTGDTLYYDNLSDLGIADGNVIMVAKDKKAIITGDHVRYNGKAGVSRVTGHPVAKSLVSNDTLFLRADTLFSFDNKVTNARRLLGQKNVFVYKTDLQSKCDSLIYDAVDSTLYFYKKPIVWSQNRYQMEADSMRALMKNDKINTMFLRGHAFSISLDTLNQFNQVKGRTITAYFTTKMVSVTAGPVGQVTAKRTGKSVTVARTTPARSLTVGQQERTELNRVLVDGNGQSIYFALDDKNKLIGMNHVECSRMNLEFAANKVHRIRFYGRPDAQFVPPQEFSPETLELDGFRWRVAEKPTKKQALWLETPPAEQPAVRKLIKKRPAIKPLANKPVPRTIN